jgi:hypothetical protein
MSWYEPGQNLSVLIESIVQAYEDDREREWADDEQSVRLREFVDSVAHALVDSSSELVLAVPGAIGANWDSARAVIEVLELRRDVQEKVEILLAWRFATRSDEMAQRCLQLAELLLTRSPGERVLRFMRRLSRCYIAGLIPESVMVSRAVLESAIDEATQRHGLTTDGRMRGKLAALVNGKYLTHASREQAWLVWTRGNTAIHHDPEAVGDALETVTMTLAVLRELDTGAASGDRQSVGS